MFVPFSQGGGTEFVGMAYVYQVSYYSDAKANLSYQNESVLNNKVAQKSGTMYFSEDNAMAYDGYMIYWLNGTMKKSYNGNVYQRVLSFHVNEGDTVEFGYWTGGISEGRPNSGTLVVWFEAD